MVTLFIKGRSPLWNSERCQNVIICSLATNILWKFENLYIILWGYFANQQASKQNNTGVI